MVYTKFYCIDRVVSGSAQSIAAGCYYLSVRSQYLVDVPNNDNINYINIFIYYFDLHEQLSTICQILNVYIGID